MLDLADEQHRARRRLACAALLAVAFAGAPPALSQAPGATPGAVQTPLELRFDIARYRVEGNTLLGA